MRGGTRVCHRRGERMELGFVIRGSRVWRVALGCLFRSTCAAGSRLGKFRTTPNTRKNVPAQLLQSCIQRRIHFVTLSIERMYRFPVRLRACWLGRQGCGAGCSSVFPSSGLQVLLRQSWHEPDKPDCCSDQSWLAGGSMLAWRGF